METLPAQIFGTAILCAAFVQPVQSADSLSFTVKEPATHTYNVSKQPSTQSSTSDEWIAGTEGRNESREVRISARLVLQIEAFAELAPILKTHDLSIERIVKDNLFIVAAHSPLDALRSAQALSTDSSVVACYPITKKRIEPDGAYAPKPTDYYFKLQAYHEFREVDGSPVGADINTRAAWPYTKGEGVILAVADRGVQIKHPDITNQLAVGVQHNFSSDADDGSATFLTASWVHGMAVAGLALAEGNNDVGMIGVAPGAKLASWVIHDESGLLVGDDKLMDMYTYHNDAVWVQNHSWGGGDVHQLVGPGLLEQVGITEAIENGRDGKGVVMVRSGGNRRLSGGNANYSQFASDPRVIGVAAVNPYSRVASYSSPGASLLVSAPGGDVEGIPIFTLDFLEGDGATNFRLWLSGEKEQTLDLWNYRFDLNPFRGTSAAAPLVSGVCALMLSVNPELTYRDVQIILALAAKHLDLDDPDVHMNGAGFLVSHNQGFGIVDAGTAVQLAKGWVNQPPENSLGYTNGIPQSIPDDGYRLTISGTGIPGVLAYITNRTSLGPIADDGTAALPIVDVGRANDQINLDLTGKAVLIERGGEDYSVKISHAAAAGAEFAIVFNNIAGSAGCPGGDELCPMGGTDFTSIPAVFIGNTQGTTIQTLLQEQTDTLAQIQMSKAAVQYQIVNSLAVEHVGVRIKTDHPLRGDLRITLISPSGTRSVLQRFNGDTSPGPVDWTYYSTHHFAESSVGTWVLELSDHAEGAFGNLLESTLILHGPAITDSDTDGLEDDWETTHFTSLDSLPTEDPDKDGYSNAREQLMRTDPNVEEIPFELAPATWNSELVRLSWPGVEGASYELLSGTDIDNLSTVTNILGTFPESSWYTSYTNLQQQFFLLRRLP